MDIRIVYSDRDIALCIKPLGISSEDGGMPELIESKLCKPEVYCVHRLDMAVGGLMVYALNKKSAAELSKQIADRQMKKEYLAVVKGRPEEEKGLLTDLLYRDRQKNKSFVVKRKRSGVKEATLEYETLEALADYSLQHITLHTGRSHQIRVQFSSRQMPLVGDVKYGSGYRDCPIALWSYALSFRHPRTGEELRFQALPEGIFPWNEFEYTRQGE